MRACTSKCISFLSCFGVGHSPDSIICPCTSVEQCVYHTWPNQGSDWPPNKVTGNGRPGLQYMYTYIYMYTCVHFPTESTADNVSQCRTYPSHLRGRMGEFLQPLITPHIPSTACASSTICASLLGNYCLLELAPATSTWHCAYSTPPFLRYMYFDVKSEKRVWDNPSICGYISI